MGSYCGVGDKVIFKNLGFAEEKSGKLEAAEVAFKKAVELDTTTGGSQNQLGVFYYNNGLFEKSIVCYKEAILKEPANETFCKTWAMPMNLFINMMMQNRCTTRFFLRML